MGNYGGVSLLTRCNLCPNLCNADRSKGEGLCLAPCDVAIINRAALHFYEEPPISGTNGSGTVFFGGCTMRCSFCQNADISREPKGKKVSPKELSEIYKNLEDQGAHNINLVTPTHFVDVILESFSYYRPHVPVVYNTSGYETVETLKLLHPFIDIYLPDCKYADTETSKLFSARPRYAEAVFPALKEMRNSKPDIMENGLMKQGVIVRHLILPNHVKNSLAVLDKLKDSVGTSTCFSLMSQFTPMPSCPELNRPIKPLEYKIVLDYALKLGFTNIFTQEISSSNSSYIPHWDFT